MADFSFLLLGDAVRDETLEFATLRVEDPECGVLRSRNLARSTQETVEEHVQIEFGNQ
jgi:hypothetical protein